jgi:hypothetical protein
LAAIAIGAVTLESVARATGKRLLEDERGRWSLARCQLIAWNLLLIPTFWTMFVCKLVAGVANPLDLGMDANIAWLLGISAAAFVGSPLIMSRKQATPGLVDSPRARGGPAGFADLVRGEDAGNAGVLDIGRVQLVLFTGVTLFAYFAACWPAFASASPSAPRFPAVTTDMLTLLGISHATYLVNKNVDRPALRAAPSL